MRTLIILLTLSTSLLANGPSKESSKEPAKGPPAKVEFDAGLEGIDPDVRDAISDYQSDSYEFSREQSIKGLKLKMERTNREYELFWKLVTELNAAKEKALKRKDTATAAWIDKLSEKVANDFLAAQSAISGTWYVDWGNSDVTSIYVFKSGLPKCSQEYRGDKLTQIKPQKGISTRISLRGQKEVLAITIGDVQQDWYPIYDEPDYRYYGTISMMFFVQSSDGNMGLATRENPVELAKEIARELEDAPDEPVAPEEPTAPENPAKQ